MGFIKKVWKNRISEYPTRRTLTKEDGSTELVTVSRSEGTVSQEGDAFSADNLNDLESRVDNAFTDVSSNLTASDNTPFRFGVDSEGKYGYIVTDEAGADTVVPFKSGIDIADIVKYYNYASSAPGTSCSTSLTLSNGKYIIIAEGFFGTSDRSYTSINSLSLKVGGTEKGTSAKSIITGSVNYEGALATASKYLICDIDESTTVTASYASSAHSSYPKAAHVALWAFKLE